MKVVNNYNYLFIIHTLFYVVSCMYNAILRTNLRSSTLFRPTLCIVFSTHYPLFSFVP